MDGRINRPALRPSWRKSFTAPASNPESVPVADPNVSASMPSRWSMLT